MGGGGILCYIRVMIPQSKSLENERRRPLSRRSCISLIYEGKSSGRSIPQDPVKSKSAALKVCSCTVMPVIFSPIKRDNRSCSGSELTPRCCSKIFLECSLWICEQNLIQHTQIQIFHVWLSERSDCKAQLTMSFPISKEGQTYKDTLPQRHPVSRHQRCRATERIPSNGLVVG